MAYFLKQSKFKKGLYLQIYEGYHDPKRGHAVQRSVKPLGYLSDLISEAIPDPISFYKAEVLKMNKERIFLLEQEKVKLISDDNEKNIGYFLLKAFFNRVDIKHDFSLMHINKELEFNIYDLFTSLVYARVVEPSSKLRTYEETIPSLYEDFHYSKGQMYRGVELLGEYYPWILEVINYHYNKAYKRKSDKVFFDATNYYFEIDFEDELRRKGPSKENRPNPPVGMGLLLDGEQIPLSVTFYPGNQSEMPLLSQTIKAMKETHNIKEKTIRIADKGLNSSKNITDAILSGDGYLYSQSVKNLSQVEKEWVLLESDYKKVFDKKGEVLYLYKKWTDDFPYKYEKEDGKKVNIKLRQKRLVTYNPKLAKKKCFEIDKMVAKIEGLRVGGAKRNEYGDASKYITFEVVDGNGVVSEEKDFKVIINKKKIEEDKKLAGYNMIITSETEMKSKEMYDVYHRLWWIEETFRILKSKLEARSVYLSNEYSIYGHFFINYVAVFILRVLQIKTFSNEVHVTDIIKYVQTLNVIFEKGSYINNGKKINVETINSALNLNTMNYYLSEKDILKLFKFKL